MGMIKYYLATICLYVGDVFLTWFMKLDGMDGFEVVFMAKEDGGKE